MRSIFLTENINDHSLFSLSIDPKHTFHHLPILQCPLSIDPKHKFHHLPILQWSLSIDPCPLIPSITSTICLYCNDHCPLIPSIPSAIFLYCSAHCPLIPSIPSTICLYCCDYCQLIPSIPSTIFLSCSAHCAINRVIGRWRILRPCPPHPPSLKPSTQVVGSILNPPSYISVSCSGVVDILYCTAQAVPYKIYCSKEIEIFWIPSENIPV